MRIRLNYREIVDGPMPRIMKASRLGICFALGWVILLCSEASPQGSRSAPAADFEVKITLGKEWLVRRKGTQEWTKSSKLSEPVAVGLLDGTSLVYVESMAIKPPKARQAEDPVFPESEVKTRNEGRVLLHLVVDDKGNVRMPIVDSSPGPAFANAAIDAVKKWTFEPTKLNGEPVAFLLKVVMEFTLMSPMPRGRQN